jgi:tetratricopeptide (TPR) repeat protein
VEVNLLEDLGPDRYRFHDLVRLHARQRAERHDGSDARARTLRRMLDWYLTAATRAEALLTPSHRTLARDYAYPPAVPVPFDEPADALAWLDGHRTQLMTAVRAAAEADLDAPAWQLVDALFPLFLRLRPYDLWTEAFEIGLAAVRRAGDRKGESRMLTFGGGGLRGAGRPEDALVHYRRALEMAREDADRRVEAQALHGLGQCHQQIGVRDRARSFFLRALEIRESIGYRRGAALSRVCLGELAIDDGDSEAAIAHLTAAHRELAAAGDVYDGGRALAFLGRAHARAGDFGAAERYLRRALKQFRETGSVHWQARTLELLGRTAEDRSDLPAARRLYEESLDLYAPVSPRDERRLKGRLDTLGQAGPPFASDREA